MALYQDLPVFAGICKSPGSAFEGSNPSPATIFIVQGIFVNPYTFEGSTLFI
jgi:hypothetical protein